MRDALPSPSDLPAVAPAGGATSRGRWLVVIGLLIALAVAAVVFDLPSAWRNLLAVVERLGVWGPVLFIAAYAVAVVFFVPGSALTLGAGALFGVVWGSVYVSVGSTLGAAGGFLVGRHLARHWVARRIQGRPTFEAIDRAVASGGWKIVLLTRLSPVFPFNLLNYAFGLTQVSFRDYVLASWIGMMPGTILYVYLGSLARIGEVGRHRTPGEWGLYIIGLLATLAVTVMITRGARRALARTTQP